MRPINLLPLGCAVLLLACSGGGGSSNPPPPPLPVSVTVTPAVATLGTTAACTAGNTQTFSAAVANSGNTAVTWTVQEAGGGSVTSSGAYTAPTTPGTYHVVATAAADISKTASATVTVLAPPSITTQPTNAAIATGVPVSFTVVATGSAPLTYQWSRSGQTVAGATAATLTLASAQLTDSGATFQCAVTNPVGLATSQSALLSVSSPVAITSFQASQAVVNFGQPVQLNWTVNGTPNALSLNGQNVLGQTGAAPVPRHRTTYTLSATGFNADSRSLTEASRGIDLLGGGLQGYGNLDGKADQARFNTPSGLVKGLDGAFYVADTRNDLIRKVAPDGTVTTLAGKTGNPVQDGTGSSAGFSEPVDLCLDGQGNLLVADQSSAKVRRVTPQGVVTTVATLPSYIYGIAWSPSGRIYVSLENKTVRWVNPATGTSTVFAGSPGVSGATDGPALSATFMEPQGLAVVNSPSGDQVFVADASGRTVRAISPAGVVSTVAGLANSLGETDGVGTAARFTYPVRIVVDGDRLLVADYGRIRVVKAPTREVGTLSKDLGATLAVCATDGSGCAITSYTRVLRVQPEQAATAVAGIETPLGSADGPVAQAGFGDLSFGVRDAAGNMYFTQSFQGNVRKLSPEGIVTTPYGGLSFPLGIAVDAQGRLVIAEFGKHRVVRIETQSGGSVTVLAGSGQPGFQDGAGATAKFSGPRGVVVVADGSVLVTDSGNNRIRRIAVDGTASTLAGGATPGFANGLGPAARFNMPMGIALDAQGNAYVGEFGNAAIRKVTPAGLVSTFSGAFNLPGLVDGPAAAARFYKPINLCPDGQGGLYVADRDAHAIRRVAADGAVTTLAGTPWVRGWKPGGLPGTVENPNGICVNGQGDILLLVSGGLMQITAP